MLLVATGAATAAPAPTDRSAERWCGDALDAAVERARRGELDAAHTALVALSDECTGLPQIEHDLGVIALRRGDADAAVDHFERALALDERVARTVEALREVRRWRAAAAWRDALGESGTGGARAPRLALLDSSLTAPAERLEDARDALLRDEAVLGYELHEWWGTLRHGDADDVASHYAADAVREPDDGLAANGQGVELPAWDDVERELAFTARDAVAVLRWRDARRRRGRRPAAAAARGGRCVADLPGARAVRATIAALVLACVAAAPSARAAPHVPLDGPVARDAQTLEVLSLLRDGDLARAAPLARALAHRFPRFALARLLHAELETIEALDPSRLSADGGWSRELIDLLAQARARLALGASGAPGDRVPSALVSLGDDVDHAVLVDLSRSELLLFARTGDGRPRLIERHYAASGSGGFGKRVEGDLKTPLGVYRITAYRPDARLPTLYGSGALTLDYPNALDRRLGRTGSGIWLHGVPHASGSRAPRSSEGCVTMPNDRLDALVARLDRSRTLVVLTDSVDWIAPAARLERRARHLDATGLPETATLIEVPGAGAPTLAASAPPSSDAPREAALRPTLAPLRFVPVEPALQASLGVSP